MSDPRPGAWGRLWPVAAVLAGLVLLGYPLALAFGLPLARRDARDLRKWTRATIVAEPPLDVAPLVDGDGALRFAADGGDGASGGVVVVAGRPVATPDPGGEVAAAALADAGGASFAWGATLEPVPDVPGAFAAPEPPEAGAAVYVGTRLARPGSVAAAERPDGQRVAFTFPGAEVGPVLVDGAVAAVAATDGARATLAESPPFGAAVRRVTGDYAALDDATLLFAAPPDGPVRLAARLPRLAERLAGESDGENRTFRLARGNVVENDGGRSLHLGDRALSAADERPEERVDGERAAFTFASDHGLVTVDGRVLTEGEDYARAGATVTFAAPPRRNARLRQHPDYLLADPAAGSVLLAAPAPAGTPLWAERYTVYAEPGCGATLMRCFYALPQHPVPFPHWIASRVAPFVGKYPLGDERNVLRATLYTTLGTLAALLLGSAVGVLLAVVFVLLRPLERALLPWVVASQTVPIIALVPVLLLLLGNAGITIQTSLLPTAIIGAYIAFFPVVVGTVKGLRSVDPLSLDLMRSYAATPLQTFLKVRFPAAVPFFFTSLRLATAAALVGALVAETESNNRRGLGFQILGQVQSGNVADVWILLLLSALLGIGLVALVGGLERLLAPWRRA